MDDNGKMEAKMVMEEGGESDDGWRRRKKELECND